jgi:hypothetical protein
MPLSALYLQFLRFSISRAGISEWQFRSVDDLSQDTLDIDVRLALSPVLL